MPMKSQKCCCCPACTVGTECCKCVCRRLCVTFTPTNTMRDAYEECETISVELDWDDVAKHWQGTLDRFDLKYYFESEYGTCYLKLRSTALGYPEGSERAWPVGNDSYSVMCSNPATSVSVPADPYDPCAGGEITTGCAVKVVPKHCTGCDCVCECLCITYAKGETVIGAKACWDGYGNWRASISLGYETLELSIGLFATADTCDDYTDPYCDKTDRTCVFALSVNNEPSGLAVPNCPDVAATWTLPGPSGGDDATISIRCAICDEDCSLNIIECCPESANLPQALYATMEIRLRVVDQTQPININPNPPIIYEGDCATYVFTLNKVEYGAVDPFHWISDFTSVPSCGCNEDTGGAFRLDLICSALTITQTVLPGCILELPYVWSDFARIFSCNPYFARLTVPLPTYGSPSQTYHQRAITGDISSWCCGIDFFNANPGHPPSWLYAVGVTITITG